MLVLNNAEIESILDMNAVVKEVESGFRYLAENQAVNQPRTEMFLPHALGGQDYYVFKTFGGIIADKKMVALRINSDVISWQKIKGTTRKMKVPVADGKYVALVHLFSTETGEPLAILHDAVISRFRVGATNAVGAKYLSREDAGSLALIGSGTQAGAQLEALCAVRPIERIRVFSKTKENRVKFARKWAAKLGKDIAAVDSAQEAVQDADIIACATNSIEPVVSRRWLRDGLHITCLRRTEIDNETVGGCHRVFVNTKDFEPVRHFVGGVDLEKRHPEWGASRPASARLVKWNRMPDLVDLMRGKMPGRQSAEEITCFANVIGLGTQFVSVAALVYELALRHGIGRKIPTDYFLETER